MSETITIISVRRSDGAALVHVKPDPDEEALPPSLLFVDAATLAHTIHRGAAPAFRVVTLDRVGLGSCSCFHLELQKVRVRNRVVRMTLA